MNLIAISSPDDPRIAGFRDIRERDLTGREGRFVAEGAVVLRVLTSKDSLCRPVSLLLAENRVAGLSEQLAALPADTPVHVAGQAVLDAIAGFHLHRGILALGARPAPVAPGDILNGDGVVAAACGVGNHDNMGGLFRNAAAFGARGVFLDGACCDPFYRKAIRVSVGAVLRTPVSHAASPDVLIDHFLAHGYEVLALTPSAREPLAEVKPGRRTAILLGSEGPGLPADVVARCRAVGVPMAGGFDSLNVAATSAVALFHVTTASAHGR